MSLTLTLSGLRSSVQQRGSFENSTDLTSAILNEAVNEGVAEFWKLIVGRWEDYYVTRASLAVTSGLDVVSLPADFYKLRKVEIVDPSSPSGYRRLRPHDLEVSHTYNTLINKRYRYRLEQGNIVLVPTPPQVETLRIFYIPVAKVLVADGDTLTVSDYQEGELVVQCALMRCYKRQDLDVNETLGEIQRLTGLVRAAADSRDASEPLYYNPYGPRSIDSDGGDEWA